MNKLSSMLGQKAPAPAPPPCPVPDEQQDGSKEKREDLKEFIFVPFTETLFNNDLLSDVNIKVHVDGRLQDSFKGHKFLLSSQSSLFQEMFEQNKDVSGEQEGVVNLQEDTEELAQNFHKFLYFLYAGRITLGPISVCHTYALAHKYGVTRLLKLTTDYILYHLHNTEAHQCVARAPWQNTGDTPERNVVFPLSTVIWFSEQCKDERIQHAVTANLQCRLEALMTSRLWETLQNEELMLALVEDGKVDDEYKLYDRLAQWLGQPAHSHCAGRMLCQVRFSLMSQDQVFSVLKDPLVLGDCTLMEYLNKAIQFHFFKGMSAASQEFTGKLYEKRTYVNLCWEAPPGTAPSPPADTQVLDKFSQIVL